MIYLTQYQGSIIGPVAKLLGYIMNFIYIFLSQFGIENVALCVVLFTFFVNALMIPFTIKQQKFSKLSSKMNPEMQAIQAKYKNKTDEASMRAQQMELQNLYDKYGTSPTGGCLPMLITFPIMLALYRVIYNIPAYVTSVKNIYSSVAVKIMASDGYVNILKSYLDSKAVNVDTTRWGNISDALASNQNYVIDILAKFDAANWADLATKFPDLASSITDASEKLTHINSFLGMNLLSTPKILSVSVIIPILAIVTQLIQTKLMTPPSDTKDQEENPAMASMKMMNTIMPFMSGAMCLMFPICIGLYWVANSVFRIFQQLLINRYLDSIDMDALIEKNRKKAEKKKKRLGIDDLQKMKDELEESKRAQSSSMKDKVNMVQKSKDAVKGKSGADYKPGTAKYKAGSIASIANVLSQSGSGDEEE